MSHSEKMVSVGHHKETHGMRDDITENTPLDDIKAPNVFERAKEEVEAIIYAVHPKKSPTHERSEFSISSTSCQNCEAKIRNLFIDGLKSFYIFHNIYSQEWS